MASYGRIENLGWTPLEFGLDRAEMAAYSAAANAVMDVADDDRRIYEILNLDIAPPPEPSSVFPAKFGLFGSQNSGDQKLSLQLGLQSRLVADRRLVERQQPKELRDLWPMHTELLRNVEAAYKILFLDVLGARAVAEVVYPERNSYATANVHIRTVRYLGALSVEAGKEVAATHADLGIASLHLYDSEGAWLVGTPYNLDLMHRVDDEIRRAGVRHLRGRMQKIPTADNLAAGFLGAGWHGLSGNLRSGLTRCLPALYHGAYKPPRDEFAEEPQHQTGDRTVVVTFANPNTRVLWTPEYKVPTVKICRPEYQESEAD